MIAVVQRVTSSSVVINGKEKGAIGKGLNILLGIEMADADDDAEWLVRKIINMRLFDDEGGVMNLSLLDIKGEALVISQFTLHASTKKGNRPSYIKAAKPDISKPLYEKFIEQFEAALGRPVATGEFGADMKVEINNDGPVTILIDSKNKQ